MSNVHINLHMCLLTPVSEKIYILLGVFYFFLLTGTTYSSNMGQTKMHTWREGGRDRGEERNSDEEMKVKRVKNKEETWGTRTRGSCLPKEAQKNCGRRAERRSVA